MTFWRILKTFSVMACIVAAYMTAGKTWTPPAHLVGAVAFIALGMATALLENK